MFTKFSTVPPVALDVKFQDTRTLIEEAKEAIARMDAARARLTRQISEYPAR